MKADEHDTQNQENKITPELEILLLITKRAAELAVNGDSKGAADILTAYQKSKLPDSHPSKNLENFQVLEDEQVAMLADFERHVKHLSAAASFLAAIALGGFNQNNMTDNTILLGDFLRDEHPELLQEAAEYLAKNKAERYGQKQVVPDVKNNKPQ